MGILRKAFKPMFEREKWKILRGDKVMIMAGKDKGQTGTILKVIRDEKYPRVVVEGLNLSKRSIKRTKDNPGGIVSVESPLAYSNVSLIDPVTNTPVRAAWRYLEDGSKVRISRGRLASSSVIPRPEILRQRRQPRPIEAGPKDTTAVMAAEATHTPGELPTALKQMLEREAAKQGTAGAETAAAAATERAAVLPKYSNRKGALFESRQRRMYHSFASLAL